MMNVLAKVQHYILLHPVLYSVNSSELNCSVKIHNYRNSEPVLRQ